jgi:hypothetical protein
VAADTVLLIVPHICKEAKKGKEEGTEKVCLSPRKRINIPKRVTKMTSKKMFLNIMTKAEFPAV